MGKEQKPKLVAAYAESAIEITGLQVDAMVIRI
jgi:hypothetical protein